MLLLFFVCALLIFCAIILFLSNVQKLKFTWKVPGPLALPLIGNGHQLGYKSSLEFVEIVRKFISDHGNYFRLWLGTQLYLVMLDPKDVEGVLNNVKLITKSMDYNFLSAWLGNGLLTSTGSKWLSRRKIITPAFHFNILEDYVSIFDKHSSILIEKLRRFEGQDFDIFPLTALCALDIIGESSMGVSLNAQNESESEYVRNVNELADIIHQRTYNVLHRYEFFYVFTRTYRRQQKLIKQLHEFTDKVIVTRREKLLMQKSNSIDFDEDTGNKKKKMALLDILLQSTIDNKPLTNLDIREEIDTFMFEGHDTTNSAIAFVLLNIAKRADIQQKCFNEICNVIGDDVNKPVDMKMLNELKYLELVIKESLRLYPSVPLFSREVTEDVVINDKKVPKGTFIVMFPYFMARDPKLWTNPLEFIPERFQVETTTERVNPYSYIPFSAGSRNCIGQKFAMLEVKSTVSKVLRNYKLSSPAEFKTMDSLELIIKSKNGVQLKLEKRVS